MRAEKAPVEPGDIAEIGDEVLFHGVHDTLDRGMVADRAISPRSGALRYRVVDSWSESGDPEAGRWIGRDRLFVFHSGGTDQAGGSTSMT